MFPTNPTLELDTRREDMLREAKKLRLAREARQANQASRSAAHISGGHTMIDPITLLRLGQAVHADRLREMENFRLARQAQTAQPGLRRYYAPVLAALGHTLVMLGRRMQTPPAARRQSTQA